MSIKAKLSAIVAKQFPEFIREDYPTFIAFVEAYYEFLDQNNQLDLVKYRDIDETLGSFVEQFRREFATNLPNILSDKRFVMQHMRDQYKAKGTEASYRLLFRLLFGKEISIDYPSTQLLRASDGRWKQDYTIFVDVTRGSPTDIEGKVIQVIAPEKNIDIRVDNWRWATIYVDGVPQISDTIVELFIDKKYFGNIEYAYVVQFGTQFEGTILPTTTNIHIEKSGAKFNVGDLYYLKSASGDGSLIKVIRVGTGGELLNAQLLKFGITYTSEFITTVVPSEYAAAKLPITITSQDTGSGIHYSITVEDELYALSETGYVNNANYAIDSGTAWESNKTYVANSYVFQDRKLYKALNTGKTGSTVPTHTVGTVTNGTLQLQYIRPYGPEWIGNYSGAILREFRTDNSHFLTNLDDLAKLRVSLGAVAKYPGYYSTNLGFLDDAIYVQDSYYYQAYSYVIKIDERLKSYQSAVKSLIHPAGMAMFGEYELKNDFDVSIALESLIIVSRYGFSDSIDAIVDSWYIITGKNFSDTIAFSETQSFQISKTLDPQTALITDSPALLVGKSLSDSFGFTDDKALDVTKVLDDITSYTDSKILSVDKVLSDSYTILDVAALVVQYFRTFQETQSFADSSFYSLNKVADTDSVLFADVTLKTTTKGLDETLLTADSLSRSVNKTLTDWLTPLDIANLTVSYYRTYDDSQLVTDSTSILSSKPVSDSIATQDSNKLEITKVTPDEVLSSDLLSLSSTKGLDETLAPEDIIDIVAQFNRLFADSVTITDQSAFTLSRQYSDDVIILDSVVYAPAILLTDNVQSAESIILTSQKNLDESIVLTDTSNRIADYNRIVDNFVSPVDAVSLVESTILTDVFYPLDSGYSILTKPSTQDSSTVSDTTLLNIMKNISDSVTVTDAFSRIANHNRIVDNFVSPIDTISLSESTIIADVFYALDTGYPILTPSLPKGDSSTVSDITTLNTTKSLSDSTTNSDAGLLELNRYGDPSYFAEHYVGTRSTF